MDEQVNKLLMNLKLVKDEFIRCKQELAVSIRKDVIRVQLKDCLENNKNYDDLKFAIENIIESLGIIVEQEEEGENEKPGN